MIIQKQLSDLREADLQHLVDERVLEDETLDYKLEMYRQSDSDKKEMLRDVSSMANSRGGHILIGIREENEQAVEVVGIDDSDVAAERLLSSCLTGVQERINGLNALPVPLANGRAVLAVFIPPSLQQPHMVTFQNEDRFWVRHRRQKLRMSVAELRDACLRIENLRENAEAFLRRQSARWSSRADQHRDVPLLRVALTPLPVGTDRVSVRDVNVKEVMKHPPGMRMGGWTIEWPYGASVQPSREGLVIDLPRVMALEVFRSGHVEFRVYFNREGQYHTVTREGGATLHYFCPLAVVEYTVSSLRFYRSLAQVVGILQPVAISWEMLNAGGWGMLSAKTYSRPRGFPVQEFDLSLRWKDERHLAISEIEVPELGAHDGVAQVILERVWNCFGYDEVPFFSRVSEFLAPPG